jgi:hypothetical protein
MKTSAVLLCSIVAVLIAASVSYAQDFVVERFVVCAGVEQREPVGVSDTFAADIETAYAYLEARKITANNSVDIVWLLDGEEMHRTGLKIGVGSRWRTYAYKNLHEMAGNWSVELRDASGNVLSSATFSVE